MFDRYQREIHYLRLSVTDLCNLRCRYCMPDGVEKLEREAVLTYEEFLRLAALFAQCGIDTVRVPGGDDLRGVAHISGQAEAAGKVVGRSGGQVAEGGGKSAGVHPGDHFVECAVAADGDHHVVIPAVLLRQAGAVTGFFGEQHGTAVPARLQHADHGTQRAHGVPLTGTGIHDHQQIPIEQAKSLLLRANHGFLHWILRSTKKRQFPRLPRDILCLLYAKQYRKARVCRDFLYINFPAFFRRSKTGRDSEKNTTHKLFSFTKKTASECDFQQRYVFFCTKKNADVKFAGLQFAGGYAIMEPRSTRTGSPAAGSEDGFSQIFPKSKLNERGVFSNAQRTGAGRAAQAQHVCRARGEAAA